MLMKRLTSHAARSFKIVTINKVLIFSIILNACHKSSHDDTPVEQQHGCRIAYFVTNDRDTSFISYNTNGTINKLRESNGAITSYIYSNNIVTITRNERTGFAYMTVVTLNPFGLPQNVRMDYDLTGTHWSKSDYEYNGDEVSRVTGRFSFVNIIDVVDLTWNDGNLISSSNGIRTTHFEYDLTKPHQDGDYFSLLKLLSGIESVRPKNLVTAADGIRFNYEYSAEGRISSITEIAPNMDPVKHSFVYECF